MVDPALIPKLVEMRVSEFSMNVPSERGWGRCLQRFLPNSVTGRGRAEDDRGRRVKEVYRRSWSGASRTRGNRATTSSGLTTPAVMVKALAAAQAVP